MLMVALGSTPLIAVAGRTRQTRRVALRRSAAAVLFLSGGLGITSTLSGAVDGISGGAFVMLATVAGLVFVWSCKACSGLPSADGAAAAVGAVTAVSSHLVSSHIIVQQELACTNTSTPSDTLEDEYVRLLIQLVTRCDLRIPRPEARATRAQVQQWLELIAESADYRHVGRGSGRQWRHLLIGRLNPNHLYSYHPPAKEAGPCRGLLVFLHGHGLNYLFVLHALRPICDALRLILLMPSFGYGNWEAPGGVEAILQAVEWGLRRWNGNSPRVLLAGLSQGGAGVSRAARQQPTRFTGLVFISATMELSVIGSPEFASGWHGRPVLVIQGEQDANVRPAAVTAATQRMTADGVLVTEYRVPHAGHFLFFAQSAELAERIIDWAQPLLEPSSS